MIDVQKLIEIKKILEESLREEIAKIDIKDAKSSNLYKTAEVQVTNDSNGLFIKTLLADYATYVDKGRGSGKAPPVSSIVEWIGRKRINVSGSVLSVAYAISKSIAKNGIAPKPFIDSYVAKSEQLLEHYIEGIFEDLTKELQNSIRKIT
jgi:hypothetical protein